jgi:hypothetical protein
MARRDPFRGHRFPQDVILLAVRCYCRYLLSYRDVRDMLAERGIMVDAASIHRWVRKFGPEIRKRALNLLRFISGPLGWARVYLKLDWAEGATSKQTNLTTLPLGMPKSCNI